MIDKFISTEIIRPEKRKYLTALSDDFKSIFLA